MTMITYMLGAEAFMLILGVHVVNDDLALLNKVLNK